MATTNSTHKNPQASGYDQHFQQWWSTARQSEEPPSPYDFLVNFGVHPDVVQNIFWDILDYSCNENQTIHGNNTMNAPGLIDHFVGHLFFTNKAKDESFLDWKSQHFECYGLHDYEQRGTVMIRAVGLGPPVREPNLVSLQDIKSLAELVATPWVDRPTYTPLPVCYNWSTVIVECMHRNYNSEVIQFLCDKMPVNENNLFALSFNDATNSPSCRQAVDHDCLLGLERLLPKLKYLKLGGRAWVETAFAKCMGMLRNATTLREVKIELPDEYMEDENSTSSPTTTVSPDSLSGNGSIPCGITDFWVFGVGSDCCGGLHALQLLPSMPKLKVLGLGHLGSSIPFAAAAPHIIRTLHDSPVLESLHLQIEEWDSSPGESNVIGVLEALNAAKSLNTFFFSQNNENLRDRLEVYGGKTVEVLEQNTKLTSVILKVGGDEDGQYGGFAWRRKIEYYLILNNNGRSIARDSNTSLSDFVSLLCSEHLLRHGNDDFRQDPHVDYIAIHEENHLGAFNIWYGLLRESPGLWSGTNLSGLDSKSRKRKVRG